MKRNTSNQPLSTAIVSGLNFRILSSEEFRCEELLTLAKKVYDTSAKYLKDLLFQLRSSS